MNYPLIPVSEEQLSEIVHNCTVSAAGMNTPEMLKFAFSCIDLTTLNSTDTVTHVAEFTNKVNAFRKSYPEMPDVAAICVYPNMASVVRENLAVAEVHVAAVAGGFPSSMTFMAVKEMESRMAVVEGADEVDMVMPLWAFLEGSLDYCRKEIAAVKQAIGDAHLKVILETGALKNPADIWQASILALESGADFIKTSTGKMAVAATPEAAVIMCLALKYWYEETGQIRGFKPAGGIVTSADALLYAAIVENILGSKWMNPGLFRIGASRLANHLLSAVYNREIHHF